MDDYDLFNEVMSEMLENKRLIFQSPRRTGKTTLLAKMAASLPWSGNGQAMTNIAVYNPNQMMQTNFRRVMDGLHMELDHSHGISGNTQWLTYDSPPHRVHGSRADYWLIDEAGVYLNSRGGNPVLADAVHTLHNGRMIITDSEGGDWIEALVEDHGFKILEHPDKIRQPGKQKPNLQWKGW